MFGYHVLEENKNMCIPPESGMQISKYFPVVISNEDNPPPPKFKEPVRSYQAIKSQVPVSTSHISIHF